MEYRVKWCNYPPSENSWVKLRNMNCARMISKFEETADKEIVGMQKNEQSLPVYKLLIKPNNSRDVSSEEAREKWSELVVNFLEKHVVWSKKYDINAPSMTLSNSNANPIEIVCKYILIYIYIYIYRGFFNG